MNQAKNFCQNHVLKIYCNTSPMIFGKRHQIRICKNCGVGDTVPRPRAQVEYYEEVARNQNDEDKSSRVKFVAKTFSLISSIYFRHFQYAPKSICDVGCGYGFFAGYAKNVGYHSVGIEPSRIMADHASSRESLQKSS